MENWRDFVRLFFCLENRLFLLMSTELMEQSVSQRLIRLWRKRKILLELTLAGILRSNVAGEEKT
jgi:hypothetical protein